MDLPQVISHRGINLFLRHSQGFGLIICVHKASVIIAKPRKPQMIAEFFCCGVIV